MLLINWIPDPLCRINMHYGAYLSHVRKPVLNLRAIEPALFLELFIVLRLQVGVVRVRQEPLLQILSLVLFQRIFFASTTRNLFHLGNPGMVRWLVHLFVQPRSLAGRLSLCLNRLFFDIRWFWACRREVGGRLQRTNI